MKVDLRTLKPNPTRDLKVDPLEDGERIKALRASIKKHGFWGGVVVGRVNGGLVTLAGHNRVEAAMATGHTSADLYCAEDLTPERMLKIYSTENATQRGTNSSAVAGTVAGAIKIIAKGLLTGGLSQICDNQAAKVALGNLASAKGIGEPLVTKFLSDIPGMNESTVKQQIANLKASEHYARIIGEVETEIAAERAAAEATAKAAKTEAERETAEKEVVAKRKAETGAGRARQKASEKKPTFDLAGVQKHLRDADHVESFRKLVTGPRLGPVLKMDKQAALAEKIVSSAREHHIKLTSKFINDETIILLLKFRSFIREEDRESIAKGGAIEKAKKLQHHFARNIAGALADAMELVELEKTNKDIPRLPEFLEAMGDVRKITKKMDELERSTARRITHVKA